MMFELLSSIEIYVFMLERLYSMFCGYLVVIVLPIGVCSVYRRMSCIRAHDGEPSGDYDAIS